MGRIVRRYLTFVKYIIASLLRIMYIMVNYVVGYTRLRLATGILVALHDCYRSAR
jgi:hypothetical protein